MVKVSIYMANGDVAEYLAENVVKAHRQAQRIIIEGRICKTDKMVEYYPVHAIAKVSFRE